MNDEDEPQHEHLKEDTARRTITMYSALPPVINLEDVCASIKESFPFHDSIEGMKENISSEGKAVPLDVIKITLEYVGDRIGPTRD